MTKITARIEKDITLGIVKIEYFDDDCLLTKEYLSENKLLPLRDAIDSYLKEQEA